MGKTKKLSLTEKTGIIALANMINKSSKIILMIILVRILTVADFGTYRQVWLIYLTLQSLCLLGIPDSIYYFIPRLNKKKGVFFAKQTFIFLIIIGILLSIGFYLASGFIAEHFNNPSLKNILKIFSLYPLFNLPLAFIYPWFNSISKHKMSAIISIIIESSNFAFVIIPLVLGFGLKGVFFGLILISSIQFIVLLCYIISITKYDILRFNTILVVQQIHYSLPLWLSTLVGVLASEIDKIIISLYYLPENFAFYSIGAIQIPLISIITSSIFAVLLPEFSRLYKKKELKKIINISHEALRKTSLFLFPIFIFLFITAKDIIILLYTEEYIKSILIFRIYLFMIPLTIMPFSIMLLSSGKSKDILWSSIIYLILNLFLNIIFIKLIGFPGPALATLLSTILVLIVYYLTRICSVYKVKFCEVLPWNKLFKHMIIACITGLLIIPILFINFNIVLNLISSGIIFFGIYILLMYKFNLITSNDIKLIKKLVHRK